MERKRWSGAGMVTAMLAATLLLVAGCGDDDSTSAASGSAASTSGAAQASTKCGLGNGKKATGEPIKVGALVTQVPGTDLTDGTDAAKAFFACVNDNGGINGRPVDYLVEKDKIDPQQVGSLATKLAETDKVDAFVGSFSVLDCPVNHAYYESHGFDVIMAGIPGDCYTTPNIATLNAGPAGSGLGAASALLRKGAKSIVIVSPKQPGIQAVNEAALSEAKAKGVKTASRLETTPVSDPAALAQALVAQAGDGGGVVVNLQPPEALKVLQAAEQQGLTDKVLWGASSAMNDASIAKALGDGWSGKIFINGELALADSDGPDAQLYRAVNKRYDAGNPLSSFGQMGFLAAKMFTDTALKLPGDQLNKAGLNKGILDIKNYTTDLLCKPWYFQTAPTHMPNNTTTTVTPKGGTMTAAEGCTPIPATYPELKAVRAYEADHDVNRG